MLLRSAPTTRAAVTRRALSTAAAPSNMGRRLAVGAAAGAGVFGLGMLGALSSPEGATATSGVSTPVFADYVRDRIRSTFGAFATAVAVTGGSVVVAYRSGLALRIASMSPWMSIGVFAVGGIGSMFLVHSLPKERPVMKFAAFAGFSSIMGLSIAPMAALGGPLMLRAAAVTAGVVGSLSFVAANAPSETFLAWGGPLAIGLGIVMMSSIGAMALPAGTAASALGSVSMYGGAALFGGLVLYDTARIIHNAETMSDDEFDPVNQSIGIYLDALNLFVRIATMMAGNRRK